jgi:hypothetical protein
VDWELVDFGDAGWDLGAVLQSYLSSWVFSMPDTGTTPAMELVASAQYPLEQMRPAIHAFWRAYVARRQLADRASRGLLERSMRYCAARLIQTAYESVTKAPQLDSVAVRLLQLSYNILEGPCEAIDHLLAA